MPTDYPARARIIGEAKNITGLQALRHGQIDGLPLAPDAEACGSAAADGLDKLLHIADIRAVHWRITSPGEDAHGVCQAARFQRRLHEALCLSQSQGSHVVLDDRANVCKPK